MTDNDDEDSSIATSNSQSGVTNQKLSHLQSDRRLLLSVTGGFLAACLAFFVVFAVLNCNVCLGMGPWSRFTKHDPIHAGLTVAFLCYFLVMGALYQVSRIQLLYESAHRAAICIGFGIIIGVIGALIGSACVDETSPLDYRILLWKMEDTYYREGHLIKVRLITWLVGADCGLIAAWSLGRLLCV